MKPNIIFDLPPQFTEADKVAFDIELFGMEKHKLHRPHGKFACLSICPDGQNVYMVMDERKLEEAFRRMEPAWWVLMNFKFDITQLRRWVDIPPRSRLHDIMLAEQVMYPGYYEDFSLQDLSRRWLQFLLDKDAQESFQDSTEMSEEQIFYAATDALVTWKVAHRQRPKMDADDKRVYSRVDLPATWAIMDFQGFTMDVDHWTNMAEKMEREANRIAEKLGFNPGSPPQTKQALADEGFRVRNTREETLAKLRKSELAPQIIRYRKTKKMSSTYGMTWVDRDLEDDGKIYSDYRTIGAETTRMASAKPNMQNVPIRDYSTYREGFIASPDHDLLVADWSSQEPRIEAEIAQDKKLISLFERGGNIYVEVAKEVFGMEITKQERAYDDMKALVLGTSYGMSVYGLMERTGMSEAEADETQRRYFAYFPGVRNWMSQQANAGDLTHTLIGRKLWLNKYSKQHYRNALNSPIQGSASDQLKIALTIMHRTWKHERFPVVAVVHDEVVADVPSDLVPEAKEWMEHAMIKSGEIVHPHVPAVADVGVGKNWLEAKK